MFRKKYIFQQIFDLCCAKYKKAGPFRLVSNEKNVKYCKGSKTFLIIAVLQLFMKNVHKICNLPKILYRNNIFLLRAKFILQNLVRSSNRNMIFL